MYFHPIPRHPFRKPLAPLDQHHRVPIEDLIETERRQLLRAIQSIKVHVINDVMNAAVFVNQGERRTGNFFGNRGAESTDDSLGERGFPRA